MTIKQTILSIQYHALKAYLDKALKRQKRITKEPRSKYIAASIAELKAAMDLLAQEYQAAGESGTIAPMDGIIPPPPPPPPPEDWP